MQSIDNSESIRPTVKGLLLLAEHVTARYCANRRETVIATNLRHAIAKLNYSRLLADSVLPRPSPTLTSSA